jgi:hypothetical protein
VLELISVWSVHGKEAEEDAESILDIINFSHKLAIGHIINQGR